MDHRRVGELTVKTKDPKIYRLGTAHLVGPGLFLTAKHVVDGQHPEVDPQFLSATVRLQGDGQPLLHVKREWAAEHADACLLRQVDEQPMDVLGPVRWGRYLRKNRVYCEFCGFPAGMTGLDDAHPLRRDSWGPDGMLNPHTAKKSGLLAIDLQAQHTPNAVNNLAGVSGAAVFATDHLVGLIKEFPLAWNGTIALAVPIQSLLAEKGFTEALGLTADHLTPVDYFLTITVCVPTRQGETSLDEETKDAIARSVEAELQRLLGSNGLTVTRKTEGPNER
jgi:hypothetical protein